MWMKKSGVVRLTSPRSLRSAVRRIIEEYRLVSMGIGMKLWIFVMTGYTSQDEL